MAKIDAITLIELNVDADFIYEQVKCFFLCIYIL